MSWRPYAWSEVAIEDTFVPVGDATAPVVARCAIGAMLASSCESPIELMFGAAVLFQRPEFAFVRARDPRPDDRPALVPQWPWERYRMDWALFRAGERRPAVFVECDGAEFHSTPEQVANDRRKDVAALEAGIPLLRFTGKDIFKNYDACALLAVQRMRGA